MSSTDQLDLLNLERDLPTTEQDIEVLRRLREGQGVPLAEALTVLSDFDLFPTELPERSLPIGWESFRL